VESVGEGKVEFESRLTKGSKPVVGSAGSAVSSLYMTGKTLSPSREAEPEQPKPTPNPIRCPPHQVRVAHGR